MYRKPTSGGPSMTAGKTRLRPLDNDLDLGPLYRWRNDSRFIHLWNGTRTLVTKQHLQEEVGRLLERALEVAIIQVGEDVAGLIYAETNGQYRASCSVGLYIDEPYRSRAIGPTAFAILARHLFFHTDLTKIKVAVADFNGASLNTVRHILCKEGEERDELRLGGRVYTVHHYALFRERYEELRSSKLWHRIMGADS